MNNKQKIALVVVILLSIVAFIFVINIQSYRKVMFTIKAPATSATIQKKNSKSGEFVDIKHIPASQTTYLKDGDYQYIPEGDTVNTYPVAFSINGKSQEITINPGFSAQYLSEQLTKELPTISAGIVDKYPTIMPGYEINNSILIGNLDWAGVIITPKNMDPNNPTTYFRVILKKEKNTWRIINKPEVILTIYNSPDVDKDILKQINSLSPH